MPFDTQYVKRIFFNESSVDLPEDLCVCWLDVMGSANAMGRSLSMVSNFVMKLHIACLQTSPNVESVELYPMIDGVYLCTESVDDMFSFLKQVFGRLAVSFVAEQNPLYRFVVRGGLSFGPVVRKSAFLGGSRDLTKEYCSNILLGLPLSQAYNEEKVAPPFGLAMDDSMRAFAHVARFENKPPAGRYWRWWNWDQVASDEWLVLLLDEELYRYHYWCFQHSSAIGYRRKRIRVHSRLAKEYFSNESEWP